MTQKKAFDCVEFQHEAGRRVAEKLRGLTDEQKVEYWRQRYEELLALQKKLRARKSAEVGETRG